MPFSFTKCMFLMILIVKGRSSKNIYELIICIEFHCITLILRDNDARRKKKYFFTRIKFCKSRLASIDVILKSITCLVNA